MAVEMTPGVEKVWLYLVKAKAPVSQERIAKHFLFSQSHAGRVLNYFVEQGIADLIKIGRNKFYKVKE